MALARRRSHGAGSPAVYVFDCPHRGRDAHHVCPNPPLRMETPFASVFGNGGAPSTVLMVLSFVVYRVAKRCTNRWEADKREGSGSRGGCIPWVPTGISLLHKGSSISGYVPPLSASVALFYTKRRTNELGLLRIPRGKCVIRSDGKRK